MKYRIFFLLLAALWNLHPGLMAQVQTECNPLSGLPVASGDVFLNYGSINNSYHTTAKSSVTLGQPLVGKVFSQDNTADFGYWSSLLLPPQAPYVTASQGIYPNRVVVTWKVDPLGAKPVDGFTILRDGSFLTNIDPGVYQFIDFNVQAGEFYEYEVIGKNGFGNGASGFSVGFVNPNGVVTGQVTTQNGNPVVGSVVSLTPTIGKSLQFDGNGEYICISHNASLPSNMFTASAWVKIDSTHDSDGILDLGSDLKENFWIKTTPSAMGKGVVVGVGDSTNVYELTYEFQDSDPLDGINDPDEWNHVAVVYGGGNLLLYVNGAFIASMPASISNEDALFTIGCRRDQSGFFDGWLDEVRIYNRLLTQTEIITTMNITVPSYYDGLQAYWKFDEGIGATVFDLTSNDMDGKRNGTTFSDDTPDVLNAGITDVSGFYAIEGINYSTAQTFTARPSKKFYSNYALEFNAAYQGCATLTNFDLPDTSHIEITVHPFDLNGKQSLLSKVEGATDAFNLFIENGKYKLTINGETKELGNAASEYQHLALSIDGANNVVTFYLDGSLVNTFGFADVTGTWTAEEWQLGAKGKTSPVDFYTGLIDEVAFYQDTLLSLSEIQLHASTSSTGGTDGGHGSLFSYFPLNEGGGTELVDMGSSMSGEGVLKNATFSIITRIQEVNEHEFQPNTRLINLNASATAVDNVNFTDKSTVAITGVVRFENTFCYQDSVEILVNGESYNPPIYTNEDGQFVGDFEPGSKVKLTPVFGTDEDTKHEFFPGFFEVKRLNVPVANVLFQNLTKREVEGQLFGGHCRLPAIPTDTSGNLTATVKVKLASLNGCYEDVIQLDQANGKFTFKNVPPIPVAVSVIEHSDNSVYSYFQVQGGTEVDLSLKMRDTVDFMYISAPNVEIGEINDGLIGNDCNLPLIYDSQKFSTPKLYSNNLRVYQSYYGQKCYLDTFNLIINNGIAEYDQEEYHSDTSTFVYEWYANNPNMLPPHTKSMQVVAKVGSLTASDTYEAIVLGERQLPGTISTSGPAEVYGVVYDPPGDGSYATIASGTETCTTWEEVNVNSFAASTDVAMKFGTKKSLVTGVGVASVTTFEVDNTVTLSGSFETSKTNSTSAEVCISTTKEISTSDGDDIWGTYADVYYGAAMNFDIGARDVLDYDFDNCQFTTDQILSISPTGFATDFVYSEWQILTEVLPQLLEIINSPTASDIEKNNASNDFDRWTSQITLKRARQKSATYDRNITFDAAATYTETTSSTNTGTSSYTTTLGGGFGVQNDKGWEWDGFGVDWNISISYNHSHEESGSTSTSNSVETSFTLADDDLNDFYSVDISSVSLPDLSYEDLEGILESYDSLKSTIRNQAATSAILNGEDPITAYANTELPTNPFDASRLNNKPFSSAPIFKLRGGESMCPWIPGTRNREEVFIQVNQNVATNVPENTPAVFQVTLGSIGPNGVDGLVYELGVDEGGNPDGAIIKVDGQPLITPIEFQFIGNQSFVKTITVEHPNTGQFTFEDLGLYFASVCQKEHSESVGYDAGDGGFLIYDDYQSTVEQNGEKEIYSRFYLPLELDVYFVEPCSPIDISFPLQNHVVTPGNENLFVTLTEYDNQDTNLVEVRLQYRPMNGDGSWINILELPRDSFANDPTFKIVQWDMSALQDGDYELRAVADCSGTIGGNLSPGISEVIRVIKETEPPALFGTPQPADGVLSPGDEISITFNELISCNDVFAADGIGANINLNNIALINTQTGQLVPFSHECVGDKIIITPEVQSKFINGKTLKARATAIQDLAGNEMEVPVGAPGSPTVNYKEWEFLVDLNPLRWQAGSDIQESVIEGNGLTVTRKIINNSGTAMDFTLRGPRVDHTDGSVTYDPIPVWMNVFPLNGTVEPGELKTITFVFPDDLPQDEYLSEINVVGTEGNKAIDVDYRVLCPAPLWEFDPAAYTYSMNFSLELNIQGEVSEDKMDIVAAFIDGELRGKAYVEYVPALDRYEAFLTVYSDNFVDTNVEFQIWDANECALYGTIIESFPFVGDDLVGTPSNPQVIHTNGLLLREIPLHNGWNWISFNLGFPDPDLDSVLVSLDHPDNDIMKSQTAFASYYGAPLNQWIGSLDTLNNTSMFQYRADVPDTIFMVGTPIDHATVKIPVQSGWNWIGYLPQNPMSVAEALSSLTPLNGDVIKNQTAFAQYVAGYGWIGNLDFMQAPEGYLLKISNPDTLLYPDGGNFHIEEVDERTVTYSPWVVTPTDFEHTMILVGVLSDDDYNVTREGMTLGAFVNGEVRGVAPAMYVEALDEWMFFMTIYANQSGEPIDFKLYDINDESTVDLNESFYFAIDGQEGGVQDPVPFTMDGVSAVVDGITPEGALVVRPNPFAGETTIAFRSPSFEEVTVTMTDATGRMLKLEEVPAMKGWNTLNWDASGLPAGIYVIKVTSKDMSLTSKVVVK